MGSTSDNYDNDSSSSVNNNNDNKYYHIWSANLNTRTIFQKDEFLGKPKIDPTTNE